MSNLSLIILIIAAVISTGKTVYADDIYYVHTDHINTPTVVTDQSKSVVWKADRDPFGKTTEVVSTIDMPIRFPGQYFDEESGLHYNVMRDYNSKLGRYVQSDPIGLDGGVNTYIYAYQNPIYYYDPNGETPVTAIGGALVGAIGGAAGGAIGTAATGRPLADVGRALVDGALTGGAAGFLTGLCGGCVAGFVTGLAFDIGMATSTVGEIINGGRNNNSDGNENKDDDEC